ncbi:MAG: 6-bladed beta-propeller [Gemmatimonadales bacterium]
MSPEYRRGARRFRIAAVLAAAALGLGCQTGGERAAVQVHDSAGVRITVLADRGTKAPEIRVEPRPSLTIGSEAGPEPYRLFRVWSALRLANGEVVVSNSGTHELRFFDSTGQYIRSSGRQGRGPGEFDAISSMFMFRTPDGDIAVLDNDIRLNLFDSTGTFLRVVGLEPGPDWSRAFLTGVFKDGSWLALRPGGGFRGEPGQVIQNTFRYARYSPGGKSGKVILTTSARPRYVHQAFGRRHYPYIPFTSDRLVAVNGAQVYLLDGAASELRVLSEQGTVHRVLQWTAPPRTRSSSVYDRFVESELEGADDAQRRLYEHFFKTGGLPLPEYVPLYMTMKAGPAGEVWLERYRLPWDTTGIWEVVNPLEEWRTEVRVPQGVRVYEIGRDYLLGGIRDSLEAEQVALFPLSRP